MNTMPPGAVKVGGTYALAAFESIGPPPITWGVTLCTRKRCVRPAMLAFEGWPYCLDHGEDAWERAVAFELNPAFVRQSLPALEDE